MVAFQEVDEEWNFFPAQNLAYVNCPSTEEDESIEE
jgi:hypothetical protein